MQTPSSVAVAAAAAPAVDVGAKHVVVVPDAVFLDAGEGPLVESWPGGAAAAAPTEIRSSYTKPPGKTHLILGVHVVPEQVLTAFIHNPIMPQGSAILGISQ
eukprot:1159624-Pelagomonas_calceolata.AAC.2